MSMIVKIQRPLGGDVGLCLVYNENRSVQEHWKFTRDLKALFRGGEAKVYHHAELRKGTLEIGKRAPSQEW